MLTLIDALKRGWIQARLVLSLWYQSVRRISMFPPPDYMTFSVYCVCTVWFVACWFLSGVGKYFVKELPQTKTTFFYGDCLVWAEVSLGAHTHMQMVGKMELCFLSLVRMMWAAGAVSSITFPAISAILSRNADSDQQGELLLPHTTALIRNCPPFFQIWNVCLYNIQCIV